MPRPPTKKQLGYLKGLGYDGPAPLTVREATTLIDGLKEGLTSDKAYELIERERRQDYEKRLQSIKMYLLSLQDMDSQYREAVGSKMVAGFRLTVDRDEVTEANSQFDKSFLLFDIALQRPDLLLIPGVDHDERQRIPGQGKFVTPSGEIVEKRKSEPVPVSVDGGAGCGALLVLFVLAGCIVAVLL